MGTRVAYPYMGIYISLSKLISTCLHLDCLNSLSIEESQKTRKEQMKLSLNLPPGSGHDTESTRAVQKCSGNDSL